MSLLTAHPLLRYGADSPVVLRGYSTHAVLYDRRLRLPIQVKGFVHAGTADKLVDRHDQFHQDDSLQDEDTTTPYMYAEHNRNRPDDPLDLGHAFASQFRRKSSLEQHDIDVMTTIIPERPGMNRVTKNLNERRIVDLGNDPKTRTLFVTNGTGFDFNATIRWMDCGIDEFGFPLGSAIPHWSWTHVIRETATTIQMWAFLYRNTNKVPELEAISTAELSARLGFAIAGNVKSVRGRQARRRTSKPWFERVEVE